MKKSLFIITVLLFVNVAVQAQHMAELRAKRIEYLGKSMNITAAEASALVDYMDDHVKKLNHIHRDSTISPRIKMQRLNALSIEKDAKIAQLLARKKKSERPAVSKEKKVNSNFNPATLPFNDTIKH